MRGVRQPPRRATGHKSLVVFVGGPHDRRSLWLWPSQTVVTAGDGVVYRVQDLTRDPRRAELIAQGYTEAWRYAFHAG